MELFAEVLEVVINGRVVGRTGDDLVLTSCAMTHLDGGRLESLRRSS